MTAATKEGLNKWAVILVLVATLFGWGFTYGKNAQRISTLEKQRDELVLSIKDLKNEMNRRFDRLEDKLATHSTEAR